MMTEHREKSNQLVANMEKLKSRLDVVEKDNAALAEKVCRLEGMVQASAAAAAAPPAAAPVASTVSKAPATAVIKSAVTAPKAPSPKASSAPSSKASASAPLTK